MLVVVVDSHSRFSSSLLLVVRVVLAEAVGLVKLHSKDQLLPAMGPSAVVVVLVLQNPTNP